MVIALHCTNARMVVRVELLKYLSYRTHQAPEPRVTATHSVILSYYHEHHYISENDWVTDTGGHISM